MEHHVYVRVVMEWLCISNAMLLMKETARRIKGVATNVRLSRCYICPLILMEGNLVRS
jgi:hypothetical protein